jgi:hypothetical protein
LARLIAEHGFQVFRQGLRSTADSGGRYWFVMQPGGGLETVAWLRE